MSGDCELGPQTPKTTGLEASRTTEADPQEKGARELVTVQVSCAERGGIETHSRFKRTMFIRTKHSMRFFVVSRFGLAIRR